MCCFVEYHGSPYNKTVEKINQREKQEHERFATALVALVVIAIIAIAVVAHTIKTDRAVEEHFKHSQRPNYEMLARGL